MKRLRLAIAIAFVCAAAACGGGGSDPVQPAAPKKDPMVVANGTFDITSALQIDGCATGMQIDSTYSVEIDSTHCSMGNWTGTWDAVKGFAVLQSAKDITHTRLCTVTRYTIVYLTFKNADQFSGSVIYRLRLGGDCGDRKPCTSSWTIVGRRQPPALSSH